MLSQLQALSAIGAARRLGLDRRGAPLSITRGREGQLTAEARVMRGDGMRVWTEGFGLDNPAGERREVVSRSYASGRNAARLPSAGTVLSAYDLME